MAQFGGALGLGPRGRRFKSCHLDFSTEGYCGVWEAVLCAYWLAHKRVSTKIEKESIGAFLLSFGVMAERFKAAVLKIAWCNSHVGSNPTNSVRHNLLVPDYDEEKRDDFLLCFSSFFSFHLDR